MTTELVEQKKKKNKNFTRPFPLQPVRSRVLGTRELDAYYHNRQTYLDTYQTQLGTNRPA